MRSSSRRPLTFSWPRSDVMMLRTHHLAARRAYRQPAPAVLSLTLSAFTETSYQVARARMITWRDKVLRDVSVANPVPREDVAVSWTAASAVQLDDDWDDLAEYALRGQPGAGSEEQPMSQRNVWKSDVARVGVLNGLEDWETWIRSCPNDLRRGQQ